MELDLEESGIVTVGRGQMGIPSAKPGMQGSGDLCV